MVQDEKKSLKKVGKVSTIKMNAKKVGNASNVMSFVTKLIAVKMKQIVWMIAKT